MSPVALACYDCGLQYGSLSFADFVVPDDVWLEISPTGHGGGILCVTCMISRCAISGIKCEGSFTSGPTIIDPIPNGWEACYERA